MTGIQQRLATGRGKFTPDYPELGTGPVNYEDSISEEFFAAERKAVFERNWLCVGRMNRLPRKRSVNRFSTSGKPKEGSSSEDRHTPRRKWSCTRFRRGLPRQMKSGTSLERCGHSDK